MRVAKYGNTTQLWPEHYNYSPLVHYLVMSYCAIFGAPLIICLFFVAWIEWRDFGFACRKTGRVIGRIKDSFFAREVE